MEEQSAQHTPSLHALAWFGGVPIMVVVYAGGTWLSNIMEGKGGSPGLILRELSDVPLLLGLMIVLWIAGGYFWAFLFIKFSALLTNRRKRQGN